MRLVAVAAWQVISFADMQIGRAFSGTLATRCLLAGALVATSLPVMVHAKDSLGVFGAWAAFRDSNTPRCYAIALPERNASAASSSAFASVGNWPKRKIRGQVYFRLSYEPRDGSKLRALIAGKSYTLRGEGLNAWAEDRAGDAALVAAMRSASRMTVRGSRADGRRFSDVYALSGAATAMDAATVACARR